MLSYQHGYHAGNFADVVKHIALTRLSEYLIQKEKPLLYLETHAGRGMYDLRSNQATKTLEFADGISQVWAAKNKLPEVFKPYFNIINELNTTRDELRFYPGSPYFALAGLRQIDRFVFSELHPREFDYLETLPRLRKKIFFQHEDGLKSLQSLLPPIERRGLIFIDPSYEIKDDFKQIPRLIKAAYTRFATGVYTLWYPIIDRRLHEQLIRGMQAIGAKDNLRMEFMLTSDREPGMTGCGLWVVNPPYTLADEMRIVLKELQQIFSPQTSSFLI